MAYPVVVVVAVIVALNSYDHSSSNERCIVINGIVRII